jgi:hypothetical protein
MKAPLRAGFSIAMPIPGKTRNRLIIDAHAQTDSAMAATLSFHAKTLDHAPVYAAAHALYLYNRDY